MAKTDLIDAAPCIHISGRQETCTVREGALWINTVWMSSLETTQTDGAECRKEPGRWCSAHASCSLGVLPSVLVCFSYTCLHRNCIYLVKKHCQTPCTRVNRGFLLGTQSRKRVSLLTVKGETVLCTRQIKSHTAFNFTEGTQDLAEAVLASQAIWPLPMWFLMPWHHFNSFQNTQL